MKTTTVTCDTCGKTITGTGWSRMWSRATKLGWIKSKDARRHYCCAKCMVMAELQKQLEKKER